MVNYIMLVKLNLNYIDCRSNLQTTKCVSMASERWLFACTMDIQCQQASEITGKSKSQSLQHLTQCY